jgi:nucleoside-diphosphate-sugar epimerase
MKLAILGGSGFMGYNLVRRLLREGLARPVVYSTSAKSLVNLARHPVDIRLVRWSETRTASVDADADFVVNYAHPFGERDGLAPERQCGLLVSFLTRALEERPNARLIHVSTMSVYEPFAPGREFRESDPIAPPRRDAYASNKFRVENALLAHPEAAERILILRPTVVYGPFCRPWTDAPLAAFRAGDVACADLSGRIQPVYVEDVTSFVIERLERFEAGVYNLPGPETLAWSAFFEHFARIAGNGRVVESGPSAREVARLGEAWRNLRTLVGVCAREQAFKDLLRPISRLLPAPVVERLKYRLRTRRTEEGAPPASPYQRPFFAEDRLVSRSALEARFGLRRGTRLGDSRAVLERYCRYRFGDTLLT